MKRSNWHFLFAFALVAQASHGCGPDHDRQMVFTAPREARGGAETKSRVRAKRPTVKDEIPARASNPPSNGIDVPIIQPD